MATDYEKFYQDNPRGLGEPTREFVEFFNSFPKRKAKVLDIGCGQGRDALFIARLGHSIVAVDMSPSGISDLQKDADAENLNITTEVADICLYEIQDDFDVIVVDRTLHMLNPKDRIAVLQKLMAASKKDTYILIADERSNLPSFKDVLTKSTWNWIPTLERKGFLFVQRD